MVTYNASISISQQKLILKYLTVLIIKIWKITWRLKRASLNAVTLTKYTQNILIELQEIFLIKTDMVRKIFKIF
jgi:hypothetical protein